MANWQTSFNFKYTKNIGYNKHKDNFDLYQSEIESQEWKKVKPYPKNRLHDHNLKTVYGFLCS